jgi:predicted hotdog family 3-hydroxylacyl-ACP dehydratase
MIAGAALAALVPHAGSMCLLDEITSWDQTCISCRSASHRRPDHPLCREGILSAVHLLEYAAQATAAHGGLLAGASPAPWKYLAAARQFELCLADLNEVRSDLHIDAERLLTLGDGVLYRFRVSADRQLLASGRLTIVSPAGQAS